MRAGSPTHARAPRIHALSHGHIPQIAKPQQPHANGRIRRLRVNACAERAKQRLQLPATGNYDRHGAVVAGGLELRMRLQNVQRQTSTMPEQCQCQCPNAQCPMSPAAASFESSVSIAQWPAEKGGGRSFVCFVGITSHAHTLRSKEPSSPLLRVRWLWQVDPAHQTQRAG